MLDKIYRNIIATASLYPRKNLYNCNCILSILLANHQIMNNCANMPLSRQAYFRLPRLTCYMSGVMLQMQLQGQCWFILHLENMLLYLQFAHVIMNENKLWFSSSATAIRSPYFLYVQLQKYVRKLKCHFVVCFEK